MMVTGNLTAKIYGGFSLLASDGEDLTPKGLKERGILALLLMEPEQRRSRAVLQDMLWSSSPPEKGAANLRRALSNIRRALGDQAWRLVSDRSNIRFEPNVEFTKQPFPTSTLFDDLDIPGTEFENWLLSERNHLQSDTQQSINLNPITQGAAQRAPEILIEPDRADLSAEEAYLTDQIASGMAERLQTLGEVTVHLDQRAIEAEATADTLVSIRTLAVSDQMLVHLRIQALPSLRFMAALKTRLPRTIDGLIDHPEMIALINKGVQAIVDHNAPKARSMPFYAIQNAVRRIYSGDRRMVATAETLLRGAQENDTTGLALAWRGFIRLTEALEFRDTSVSTLEAAVEMANEATKLSPQNPVIWALAAQIHIQLAKDLDLGTYCAKRSVECLNDDPYALDAMSMAKGSVGDPEGAHLMAVQALRSATGLSNEFSWDMLCCLTALGLNNVDDAIKHAASAHLKVPGYRPAVRYLTALNIFNGNETEARKYLDRLKKLEPDFTVDLMKRDDYPLHTLQRLGLVANLNMGLVS